VKLQVSLHVGGVLAGHGKRGDCSRPTGRLTPYRVLTCNGARVTVRPGTLGTHARLRECPVERAACPVIGVKGINICPRFESAYSVPFPSARLRCHHALQGGTMEGVLVQHILADLLAPDTVDQGRVLTNPRQLAI
jgi:hypothetical protein